jgi:hypothetical protein
MDSNGLALSAVRGTCLHSLRFTSLHDRGRAVEVPCDEAGNVDVAALPEGMRAVYYGAQAMVGREYSCPIVQIVK